jgi:hypothetical protein
LSLIIGSKFFLIVSGKDTYGIILVNNSVVGKITPAVKTFFIDGTFSVAPQGFEQLLNIAVCYRGSVLIAFSVLMTSKNSDLYIGVLRRIQADYIQIEPRIVMADFEAAISVAVRLVFPDAIEKGCEFHFGNALSRRMRKPGNVSNVFSSTSEEPQCHCSYLFIAICIKN